MHHAAFYGIGVGYRTIAVGHGLPFAVSCFLGGVVIGVVHFPAVAGEACVEAYIAAVLQLLQFHAAAKRDVGGGDYPDAACAVFYCAAVAAEGEEVVGIGLVDGFIGAPVKLLSDGGVVLQGLYGEIVGINGMYSRLK